MATPKKIGVFPKPLDHDIEAAKLQHLMAVRGVDSVRANVDGKPALIDVSSLDLAKRLETGLYRYGRLPRRRYFPIASRSPGY